MGGTNKPKENFCLFEKHYKHVGTAFNKDIRDGKEMREIVGKIKDGTFQKPVILLLPMVIVWIGVILMT